MYRFSDRSKSRLMTCDKRLQEIFEEVIEHFDCTIICGHRNKIAQDAAFNSGNTQLKWPKSKHNHLPSLAVDAVPYPLDWGDRERMTLFAGHVLAISKMMGYGLKWGGDWDEDTEVKDNKFDDLVHFELTGKDEGIMDRMKEWLS